MAFHTQRYEKCTPFNPKEETQHINLLSASQLAKLHQLSMQQGLNPIAQPASTVIPGMYIEQ